MPKVRFWKTLSIFPFSDRNKGGWLEGWIKAGRWLNPETWRSSSSLPRALVFLLSSCGPAYLHPRVQQSPVKPRRGASEWAGKDGEGPWRLQAPLELPSCRRNQYKTQSPAQLWVGFPVLVCGLGARRPPKDRPCVALSAAAPTPKTGPQIPMSTGCVWFCWRGSLPK